MNKPRKCKNCEWYGKPYWSVINPCDNCDREDYYKVMESYYTEDYVKSLLQQIEQLTNNWNELEEWLANEYNEWSTVDDEIIRAEARQCIEVLDKMEEIKEGNK